MDQYPPYSIQQQPPVTAAAASYPYPDGPQPEKNPSDGVAQMAQNPYYQVPVDPQVNFTGGFVPAEVPVPNGMVPQPAYNSYYPEQVPQQQQQLAGPEPPVQYSQQDYAREANVAPVEYLPEVGMPAIQQGTGSVQQVEQSAEGVANVASAPGFCEQIQQGMDLPQAVASGETGSTVLVNDKEQQLVGSEPTPIPPETTQLSTPPPNDTVAELTESTQSTDAPPESTPSALDALGSTTEPATESTEPTPIVNSDAAPPADPPIVELDDNSKDDCVITSPTPRPELCSSTKKKRRRIVQEDDSDDDECERERMELLRSPEPPAAVEEGPLDQPEEKEKTGEDGEGPVKEGGEEEGRSESRNSCEDRRDDDAPSIFQNVVMIPAADAEAHKRKKIRVLDSDDDDEDGQQAMATTVDDIGLTGEGADELNPEGGMDEGGEDGEFGEGLEQIVAMDAPIVDQSRMLEEGDDDEEEEEQEGSDKEKDKEGSDREEEDEVNGSDAEEPPVEEEEEEEAEEGVEMITAEDDAGEAIGIATDDEKELDEPEAQESEPDERGSDQEEEASEDPDAERSESVDDQNSQDSNSNQRKSDEDGSDREEDERPRKKSGESGDEVVCQNEEVNTISLLTDEEDDNGVALPPPKKELPVVRIVNIKKELLDVSRVKKERYDPTSYYQQQHQIKQRQLEARKKEKKKKRERNFDNNDPFGAWSSSSTDDEFIPNDIYFGTPDRVFTANTKIKCQRQKQLNERYSAKYGRSGKRRYSDDSDGEERRKRKQKLDQLSRLNLPSYQQAQLQTMIKKKKKRRQDRFYDKSQDIPNDIYFGNVNVPLHVLYAFGDSSSEDERPNTSWRSESSSHSSHKYHRTGGGPGSRGPYKKSSSSSSAIAAYERSSVSPSSDRSVQAMREYLKIAGFKHVKFHKLWEGCKSNQERANAILRLMQDKGLEGEPTVAKCRELRKQLQMEREAQVLDTSLIIDSGEGRITRRSKRNPSDPNAPSTSGTVVPPESAEAINRIRSLVDPDSDGE
ncbi:protein IWS1 homolog [Culex pipiens pallens]|uniref:protein IWS1 homolog n=1 Tax=Culex pipiens pallens TaxID=42434 RepID=UPI001954C538|nr:protein IWS1 homolog [Culex pipiens pallens]